MAFPATTTLLSSPSEIAATTCLLSSQEPEESRRSAFPGDGDHLTNPGREILDISSDYQRAYSQLDYCWIVISVALPIYILIKSRGFSTLASVDQPKSSRPLRSPPNRNKPVLSLRTTPSAVDVQHKDHAQSPNERGRTSAAVIATDGFPSPHDVLPGICDTQTSPSLKQSGSGLDHTEAKSVINSSRNRSALVQVSPQAGTRFLSASRVALTAASIYVPPTNSPARLRYRSLYGDSEDERRALRSARQVPLQAALFGHFDIFSLPPGLKWFVLFVGVNNGHVRDPEHDLALLEQMLRQSSTGLATIHFESLAGSNATRDKIKAVFTSLYLKAGWTSGGSRILVFLSGLGNEAQQMCLSNTEFISEFDFHSWILDMHTQWDTPDISSLILADICRPGKHQSQLDMGSNRTNFVRSCSSGQLAHVLAFKFVPWSCFLLAFFLASSDLSDPAPLGPMDFEALFKHRMKQLGELVSRVHNRIHERNDVCKQCTNQDRKCDPPKEQTPEGGPTGWYTLGSFGKAVVVACPESVKEIVSTMTRKMMVFGVLETCSDVSNTPSILHPEAASQRTHPAERGATQPVFCVKA